MPDVYLEQEISSDVDADAVLPPMTQLIRGGPADVSLVVDGEVWQQLQATDHGTVGLRLAASGLTMRGRTGGEDAAPQGARVGRARSEVRGPLGRSARDVPTSL